MNIWKVEKTDKGWGNPIPLSSVVNQVQESGEEWPSSNINFIFSNDDTNFIYTTMTRGTKSIEIYTTTLNNGNFSKPERINGLFNNEKL